MATHLIQEPEFDQFAENYESLFKPWLKLAGSNREHFARARILWLARLLREYDVPSRTVMDFGCGTGIALPLLLEVLKAEHVIGVDPSERSLQVARRAVPRQGVTLSRIEDYLPRAEADLVFCNGVFHHIAVKERAAALDYVYRSLRPGGLFALWENNPWNPIVLYSMKTTEVDRNAIPIASPEARRLVHSKFELARTDYLFFFPAYLRKLQRLESAMIKVPLGAQYQVLSRKQ